MTTLLQDLRFAWRSIRRNWLLAGISIVSLAVAIGGKPDRPPVGSRPSQTTLWAIFFGAWLAYAGLMTSLVVASGRPLGDVAARIVAHVVAHVLPALLLARHRRSLLRPDRTMVATVVLLVVAGLLYAGVASGLSFLFYGLDDPLSGAADMTLGQHIVSRFASAVILT